MLKFYESVERPDCLFEDSSNLTVDFPALTGFTVWPEILVLLALLESSTPLRFIYTFVKTNARSG